MGIDFPGTILHGQKTNDLKVAEKTTPHPASSQEKNANDSEPSALEVERAMQSLVQAANIFNKRLTYSINEEIGRVVVKVIDTETDKVIKEIPAREIQRLIAHLKEAIGLMVDEVI